MPITDPKKLIRAAGTIINNDLVLVETARPRICMNRSLIIGFTISEMAKLIMYKFYYEALLRRYGDKLRLCFTDTDSFIFWVETPDLHADMADMMVDWLDTSNFPPEHPLFSKENKRKLGFFKSETGAHFLSQLCAIRSKMYSLWTPTSDDPAHTFTKAKGLHTFVLSIPYPPLNATFNSISSSPPLPSSHPMPAPQIRFHDFDGI